MIHNYLTIERQKQLRDLLGDNKKAEEFVHLLNIFLLPGLKEEIIRLIHRYKLNKDSGEYQQIEELNKLSIRMLNILKRPKGDLKIRLEKFGFSQGFEEDVLNFYGATIVILEQVKVKRGARPKIKEHEVTLCARMMKLWQDFWPRKKISSAPSAIFYQVMEIVVGHDPRRLIERTMSERMVK